jgi:hypothetical protein
MANFKSVAKSAIDMMQRNMPHILTSMAVTGAITTPILAVSATPKALMLLQDEEDYLGRRLTKTEVFKTAWKCYIPATSVGLASIACIIGANSINTKRNAALAGLYSLTETAFKEYQAKVIETIGQNKEIKVRDDIAREHLVTNPVSSNGVIITGNGDILCYDSTTGRYFRSDIEKIRQVVNEINFRLRSEMWISLNEFFYELGLKEAGIGDEVGFHIDNGGIEVDYSSQIAENGQPCLVLTYKVYPRHIY